jgi:hypothetical protein
MEEMDRYRPRFDHQYADGTTGRNKLDWAYGSWRKVRRTEPFPEESLPVRLTVVTPHERMPEFCPGPILFYVVNDTFRNTLQELEPGRHRFFPVEVVFSSGRRAAGDYFLFLENQQKLKPLQDLSGHIVDPLNLTTTPCPKDELSALFTGSMNCFHFESHVTILRFAHGMLLHNPRTIGTEVVETSKVQRLFPYLEWDSYRNPSISLYDLCRMIPVLWQQAIVGKHYCNDEWGGIFYSDEFKKHIDDSLLKWFQFHPFPVHDLDRYRRMSV